MQGFGIQRTHKNIVQKEKVLPWQHLLPGVANKIIGSNPCKCMESKAPIKIFIYKSKKHKKVLPCQHLLPGVAEKLISSNLCRGTESKKTHKNICKSKKQKKLLPGIVDKLISSNPWRNICCHGNTCCQLLLKS